MYGGPKKRKTFEELIVDLQNFDKLIKYPKNYPADEPKRRCPDIGQAKKYLNFNPKIDIKLGIARMLKYNGLILKK